MPAEVHARLALLPSGWAKNVTLTIDGARFTSVRADTSIPEHAHAIVLPGLCNAHSHAFQRALAGFAEHRAPSKTDTFWTWRKLMYALAERMDAAALEAVASQLYAEMLTRGYTSVVEFHYLHRAAGSHAMNGEMYDALRRAADGTGIHLTYTPILYERSGFEASSLSKAQEPFGLSLDAYFKHYETLASRGEIVALGAHSLRAVTPASLQALDARSTLDGVPMHIHIAEQPKEVEACLATHGARPIQWLLDHAEVDERWTLVHATHLDEVERTRLAQSAAVVCLCPSTEANLGDGIFPLADFLSAGGRFSIGSDSHVSVDPFEELRWLEYGQRLQSGQRNLAAHKSAHTGHDLFVAAHAGGAQSGGMPSGLVTGASADLMTLDDSHPALLGHGPTTLLDALVFANHGSPIERVMARGRWRVEGGRHERADSIRDAYAACVRSLALKDVR